MITNVLLGLAAGMAVSGASGTPLVPLACPVTQAPVPSFVPPPPNLETPRAGSIPGAGPHSFWFGSPRLWTSLPDGGTWRCYRSAGSTRCFEKTLWWQQGWPASDAHKVPRLTVTARQLDGDAKSVPETTSEGLTGSPAHPEIGAFFVVGVQVPTPGCWEISGKLGDQELSFVIRVLEVED
jgi:hypothetical protein